MVGTSKMAQSGSSRKKAKATVQSEKVKKRAIQRDELKEWLSATETLRAKKKADDLPEETAE